jgi:hypothetical protein
VAALARCFVICALVLAACTSTPSSTPPASDTLAPAGTSATAPSITSSTPAAPFPTSTANVPRTSWVQVFGIENGTFGDMIEGPDGPLVAGCISMGDELCGQPVMASRDASGAWHTNNVDGPADIYFDVLGGVGDRLIAVGYGHYGADGGAIVWTSVDGRSWSPVESASFRGRAIDEIIESPVGAFAVGYEAPIDSDNTSGFLLWPVRADGSFGNPRVVDTPHREPFALGIVWDGEELLAWGTDRWNALSTTLLTSPDAKTWTHRAEIAGQKAGVVTQIVAIGERLVAVGYKGSSFPLSPRAWTSTDAGRTWALADLADVPGAMNDVTFERSRYVSHGSDSTGDTVRLLDWSSPDGTTWKQLPADEETPAVEGFSIRGRRTIDGRMCVSGTFFDGIRPEGRSTVVRPDPAGCSHALGAMCLHGSARSESALGGLQRRGLVGIGVGRAAVALAGGGHGLAIDTDRVVDAHHDEITGVRTSQRGFRR